ncbi:MAG: M48 family metallopeptidase [Gammaproteobacteria bacterium]|nr:M48 family metallopeptidase [Gammaproteobacteria bacterium]
MAISGQFYDGMTSARHAVEIKLTESGMIAIKGAEFTRNYRVTDVADAQRLGGRVRILRFRDNASLETDAVEAIDSYLDQHSIGRTHAALHKLERSLKYVAMAAVFTVAIAWLFLTWGVPAIAKVAAFSLPVETQDSLGEGTLEVFDQYFMEPSQLDEARRQSIRIRFTDLIEGLEEQSRYRLEFRDSEDLGANAFALPSGTIVVTDDLVELAEDPHEIDAVLAHEIGHVHYRHSLRGALQSSATAVLLALMSGDIASMSSFASALPTLILTLSYTRDFEREADDYARQLMQQKGIPLHHFANMLRRLSESHGVDDTETGFLDSHPAPGERIQSFL